MSKGGESTHSLLQDSRSSRQTNRSKNTKLSRNPSSISRKPGDLSRNASKFKVMRNRNQTLDVPDMPKFEEEEIVEVESAFDEHQELLKPIRVSYDNSAFKNTITNFKGKMDEQEKKEWIKKKILKTKVR